MPNVVLLLEGVEADCQRWGRKHGDVRVKLAKALDALTVKGAEIRGAGDSRFGLGCRKLRMPRANTGSAYGYRIPYFAFELDRVTFVPVGGIYPKPEFKDGVPAEYVERVAIAIADTVEVIVGAAR